MRARAEKISPTTRAEDRRLFSFQQLLVRDPGIYFKKSKKRIDVSGNVSRLLRWLLGKSESRSSRSRRKNLRERRQDGTARRVTVLVARERGRGEFFPEKN